MPTKPCEIPKDPCCRIVQNCPGKSAETPRKPKRSLLRDRASVSRHSETKNRRAHKKPLAASETQVLLVSMPQAAMSVYLADEDRRRALFELVELDSGLAHFGFDVEGLLE